MLQPIVRIKESSNIPHWMRFYRAEGWHDFEIELDDEAYWVLKGIRGTKPPVPKTPKPKKSQASYANSKR